MAWGRIRAEWSAEHGPGAGLLAWVTRPAFRRAATTPWAEDDALEVNPEIAARIEGRLERLGLSAEEADRLAGLPAGSVAALVAGSGALPRGTALRRLAVALDAGEEFILGLEPGDLIPPEMLEEAQGELGLLAPDEEALLRHYRRLDVPVRAAVALLVARAAGPEPEPPAVPARRRRK